MATKTTKPETYATFTPKALGFDPDEIAHIGQLFGFDERTIAEHTERLEAMIPPEWKAERYIHRLIAGNPDFKRFDLARMTRHNIIMPGPTGAGKTTAAIAYAAFHRMPYTSIEFDGGFNFGDVIGATRWGLDGKPYFMYGDLALIALYGGLCDCADCNLAPPKFVSPMFCLLDQRQILPIKEAGTVIKKHPNCLIFGSYNPGYKGTSQLNEAFVNRFAMPMEWGYDDAVEDALIGAHTPTLVQIVRRLRQDDDITTDIGTNVMEEFLTFATHAEGDIDIAIQSMMYRFPGEEQEVVFRSLEAERYSIAAELGLDLGLDEPDEVYADEATDTDEPAF